MQNYDEKPKRKRKNGANNPYILVAAGIVIGLIGAAAIVVFLFLGVSTTSEPVFVASPIPTVEPFNAQGLQATPIANRIQAAAISGDGTTLAYVSVENGISHIYLNELRVERNLTGNQYDLYQSAGTYNDVVFSPDGSKLIATIDNGSALLFDVSTRTLIEEYAQIGGAAFTNDSNTLVLVGRNSGIRVLDVTNTPTLIASRASTASDYLVGAVAISSDQTLAIALNERIEIYQLADLSLAPQIITPNNGFVQDLAFHPTQSNTLALALAGSNVLDGVVQIYDLNNTSRSQYDFGTRVFALAFSPDGDWLAVAGGESGYAEARMIAFRWDASDVIPPNDATFYQPITFSGHNHTIMDVAFSREGYLLSAAWDGSVRLWELTSPDNAISVYIP